MTNAMTYKLICCDLDGTLLNSKHQLCKVTVAKLKELQRKGTHVAIVTGRAAFDAKYHSELIGKDTYFIASNGSAVGAVAQEELIYETAMSTARVQQLLDIVGPLGVKPMLALENKMVAMSFKEYLTYKIFLLGNHLQKHIQFIRNRNQVNVFLNKQETRVHKIVMFPRESMLVKLRNSILEAGCFELCITSGHCFEVTEKGMNKSSGVDTLVRHLGIDLDQVIAFGDSENDISMLEKAGLGVAMANADREVKASADRITQSNDQQGIVRILEEVM